MDDENEIPMKVIALFSVVHFCNAINSFDSLVRSVFWFMVSTKISIFVIYVSICVSGCLYSVLAVQVMSLLWRSSRPVSLLVQVPHVASSTDVVRCCFE